MSLNNCELFFRGPYSARPNTVVIDLPQDLKALSGVYLWTIECDGGYLVHYVGKTIRPFSSRFAEHTKWHESGRDVLDPDYFPKLEKWLVENPSRETIIRFFSLYRVFLGPIVVDKEVLVNIEHAIIHKLLSADQRCKEFLGNTQKRNFGAGTQRVPIRCDSLIHGLGDHVFV